MSLQTAMAELSKTALSIKRERDALIEAAKPFHAAFTYDPGHSDLDNEQPITITVTLGAWRRLNFALAVHLETSDA